MTIVSFIVVKTLTVLWWAAARIIASGVRYPLRRKFNRTIFMVCICIPCIDHWYVASSADLRASATVAQSKLYVGFCWEHGLDMAVHFGNFLSAKQDARLQAELTSLPAFPEHLQHCLVTGPERRCQTCCNRMLAHLFLFSCHTLRPWTSTQREDIHPLPLCSCQGRWRRQSRLYMQAREDRAGPAAAAAGRQRLGFCVLQDTDEVSPCPLKAYNNTYQHFICWAAPCI